MSALVECPGCGKRYKVGDHLAGQRVRCGCGKTLIVPNSRTPQAGEVAVDDIPDDLLDETIWDAEPKAENPAETTEADADVDSSPVAKLAPGVPAVAGSHPRPTETDESDDEPETFWDRFKSPSRELIGWLSILYGAAMAFILFAMTAPTALIFYRFSGLALAILIGVRLVWFSLAVLIAAGGVLIRKRHPLGPACAGLGSAGTCFSWLWSLLWAFHPIHIFLAIFAVQFVFIYSVPTYIIYWCLKEEKAIDEDEKLDKLYPIRESLKERMIEENLKEWESK